MENQNNFRLWAGIDWATERHQVCVVNEAGRVVAERVVEHRATALAALASWLEELADGSSAQVAVAIEVPRGAVVETLLERGLCVFALNPKQLDRFRDRHSPAGAKDDRRDAFVLADSLRTDEPCFRRLQVDAPLVIELRETTRNLDEIQTDFNRAVNRLREQLHRYFPQMLGLSPAANEPWFWELLELAPTPVVASKLRRARISALLKRHRIRRLDAVSVLAALAEPALQVAPGTVEAASAHVALLLQRLQLLHAQKKTCEHRLEDLLHRLEAEPAVEGEGREHRDVTILRSLLGVGKTVAATMLAEASAAIRSRDYHALRALAGVAPVTRQSGKTRRVSMRKACNRRLRNAVYHWARVSIQHDALSRAAYAALRARGHSHGRALRSVADRLLRILFAMLRDGTLYDSHHSQPPRQVAA